MRTSRLETDSEFVLVVHSRDKSSPFGLWSEQNPTYKRRNEDGGSAGLLVSASGQRVIFAAVADGVSGLPNGDEASRLAVRWPQEVIPAVTFDSTTSFVEALRKDFDRLNERICALPGGAGTTLTVVFLVGKEIVVVHVGDTTCFYFDLDPDENPRGLTLTRSDSVVGQARAAGTTDEELEGMHQHALAKCLGDPSLEPAIVVNPPNCRNDRGTILLTTDGITDVWSPSEILPELAAAPDATAVARNLCTQALVRKKKNQRPNRDNITAVLIKLENFPERLKPGCNFVGSAKPLPAKPAPVPWYANAKVLAAVILVATAAGLMIIWSYRHSEELGRSRSPFAQEVRVNPPPAQPAPVIAVPPAGPEATPKVVVPGIARASKEVKIEKPPVVPTPPGPMSEKDMRPANTDTDIVGVRPAPGAKDKGIKNPKNGSI